VAASFVVYEGQSRAGLLPSIPCRRIETKDRVSTDSGICMSAAFTSLADVRLCLFRAHRRRCCRLSGAQSPRLSPCAALQHSSLAMLPAQTFTTLADGVYVFSVRTVGAAAGYQASAQFTVGAAAPVVRLVSAPATVTRARTAQFAFVSSGDVAFQCSLARDGAAASYSACTSPQCALVTFDIRVRSLVCTSYQLYILYMHKTYRAFPRNLAQALRLEY